MTDDSANPAASDGRMPAIYLGHGAPPLLEDAVWMKELGGWARDLPRPSAILIVSAHWQTAPMALSATTPVPLVYDFYGFPEQYYRLRYDAPAAPDLDPQHLFDVGRRLAPLRDEGVLIVGSGFLTHGLPFIHEYFLGKPGAPQWSIDFDQWAMEALNRGDVDSLFAFREKAPGMPFAHPTVEHFAPLFVTLGAVARPDDRPDYAIEGFAYGLSKRSFEAR